MARSTSSVLSSGVLPGPLPVCEWLAKIEPGPPCSCTLRFVQYPAESEIAAFTYRKWKIAWHGRWRHTTMLLTNSTMAGLDQKRSKTGTFDSCRSQIENFDFLTRWFHRHKWLFGHPCHIEELHDLLYVLIGMYGYERVGISLHKYLLAPSKVWTLP